MKLTHLTRPWALCATLVALLVALPAPATDAQTLVPTVRQIEVEGTRRVDPASIRGRIYTQVGQDVDAQRLSDAGVKTQLTRYDGVFHGFFGMGAAIDKATQAVNEACAALRSTLNR